MKNYLERHRFDLFTKNGNSTNDVVIKIVSVIKKNDAMNPQYWQCEYRKLEVLKNAVYGMSWACSPIDRQHVDMKTFEEI